MKKTSEEKKYRSKRAQSVLEFLILSGIILVAVIVTNFIGRMQLNFNSFFDKATQAMR